MVTNVSTGSIQQADSIQQLCLGLFYLHRHIYISAHLSLWTAIMLLSTILGIAKIKNLQIPNQEFLSYYKNLRGKK